MKYIPQNKSNVTKTIQAALLLLARPLLEEFGLPHPTAEQVLTKTGARHSNAYEIKNKLAAILPTLTRPVGRPKEPEPSPCSNTTQEISLAVIDFVYDHPGCVHENKKRRCYSDTFRRYILELGDKYHELSLSDLAATTHIPVGTLKYWSYRKQNSSDSSSQKPQGKSRPVVTSQAKTILEQYSKWDGNFSAFCEHLKNNLRISWGRTQISSILERYGERSKRRRSGRSPDEKALKKSFQTFFPGAQWQGDGTPITVQVDKESFTFNLELITDSASAAAVGASVRDEEDSQVLIEAFNDGVHTTGAPPIAIIVDNRASNHTADVDNAISATDAMLIRSTLGRPQNKPHVEGAFGLFSQSVPDLKVSNTSAKILAKQILILVVLTWARTLNHKPQQSHGNLSRVDQYQNSAPTEQEVAQARAALKELHRKQQQAYETRKARQDPVAKEILDKAFERLNLDDPDANIRSAIARYPLDAITNGIAIFEGKQLSKTLPSTADGRYLLGIVRNVSEKQEGLKITEELLRERLAARDYMLSPLFDNLEHILQNTKDDHERLKKIIDHSLMADRNIDRLFWLSSVSDQILIRPSAVHAELVRFFSRRVFASFDIPYAERLTMVQYVTSKVILLD